MGRGRRAPGQDGQEREGALRPADENDRARDQGVSRPSADRANGSAQGQGRGSAAPARRTTEARAERAETEGQTGAKGGEPVRLRGILIFWGVAALSGCAHAPRPLSMGYMDRARQGPPVGDAPVHAPQAFARAELLRNRAEQAYHDGDLTAAEALSDQAIAAYTRATIEARLAVAETRLAEARLTE